MSVNESKTVRIVYDHFKKFEKDIKIEEKKSDNPKINKLLRTASKSGTGPGYPEFIISFKENKEFIIVIECKGDLQKHISPKKDDYKNFAVDGALLYSSYLSKDFDVLSIGVSGEKLSELKITHYLQIKKENKHYEKFSNKLLSPNNYIDEYLKSPEKFRQDYNSLLDFANELNTKLHLEKITENKRCILISSVLIALEDKAFKKSYKLQDSPQGLAKNLVNTVLTELKDSGVDNEKLDNIETELKFIHSDSSLSQKENVLQAIIDDIESNIQSFIKNHKYFDVLGKLYIAFLQYANSDKGLGIVLTPPHITELFCDLAQVNKNSVIYDNCTGTGGFLISAMKKMIVDSKGDQRKIKEIKNSQLYGTEYQSHVYSLAVTNMSIHQDGKTTIFKNDCFDQKLIKKVQLLKPNIGFLNPPYKSDKKKISMN